MKRNLIDQANSSCGIQGGEKYARRIFEKLFERMELCINDHGDYSEHLRPSPSKTDLRSSTVNLHEIFSVFEETMVKFSALYTVV